jgi:hypothetical protein
LKWIDGGRVIGQQFVAGVEGIFEKGSVSIYRVLSLQKGSKVGRIVDEVGLNKDVASRL